MILRSVKPEEIETLKALTPNDESFYTDDIWYKQSKVCTDDEGGILGFALVKPHSIYDFFGGEVPPEEGVEENKKWWIKEEIELLKDRQYETLFYIKPMRYYENSDYVYWVILDHLVVDKQQKSIGLLWTPKFVGYEWKFYNNAVYIFNYSTEKMEVQAKSRPLVEERFAALTLTVEEEYKRNKAEFFQRPADLHDSEEQSVIENINTLTEETKNDFEKSYSTHPFWKNMKKRSLYRLTCTRALYKKYIQEKWLYSFWKKVGHPELIFEQNGKVGLKDYKGDVLLPPEYDEIRLNYVEEELVNPIYIMARKGKWWGVVDSNGDIQLPFDYEDIYPMKSADYAVRCQGKWGVYSVPDHEWRLPCSHDIIYNNPPFMDVILVFSDNGKLGWTGCPAPLNDSDARYDDVYFPRPSYFHSSDYKRTNEVFIARSGDKWYPVNLCSGL